MATVKLLGIPVFTSLPKGMRDEYAEISRHQFKSFLQAILILYPTWEVMVILWQLILGNGQNSYTPGIVLITYYMILLLVSTLPIAKKLVHFLGVAAITGTVLMFATIASYSTETAGTNWAIFFVPLQMVPLMTSFTAALSTLWLSTIIILDFARQANLGETTYEMVRIIVGVYVIASIGISYLATQYRRTSFLLGKQLEAALHDAKSANEAKSAFLATMSHEVRTPLTGILGIVSLIKHTQLSKKQRDYIDTIQYSGDTLLALLNDLLDITKIETGKLDLENLTFNTRRFVSSVVDLMKSRAEEKGVVFDFRIAPDVPEHIEADPTRLRQVLLNLVSNAIKFTEQGAVDVYVSIADIQNRNMLLRFEITDTGIGIPHDVQQKLFQEYTQVNASISRRFGGTGLGLSICRKIVELMDGRIGLNSEPGHGSTFWFEIPVTSAKPSNPENDAGPSSPAFDKRGDLHILVAEDNGINQRVIAGLLERCGHTVTIAGNGEQALSFLRNPDFPCDLVFMDVQMPVLDGISATRQIRELSGSRNAIPIIALTAGSADSDRTSCLDAGMDDFLMKPLNPNDLYAKINRYHPGNRDSK